MFGIFRKADEVAGNFGTNALEDKVDLIEEIDDKEMTVDKAKLIADDMARETAQQTVATLQAVKTALTPGFLQRYYKKKIHEKVIANTESSIEKFHGRLESTITKELKAHGEETRRFRRLKKKLDQTHHLRQEVKKALEVAKAVEAQADVEDYKHRRQLQLTEIQAAIDKEEQELIAKQEQEALEIRSWRISHWGEEAKKWQKEAIDNKTEKLQVVTKQYKASVNKTYDEWANRDFARVRMQVEGNLLSEPVGLQGRELGIFGKSSDYDENEHVPGLDDFDIHVFTPAPQTDYEVASIDAIQASAETARLEALYGALTENSKTLSDTVVRIKELKDGVSRDLRQVQNEQKLVDREQLGPPRRLPLAAEIASTNARKERIANLTRRVEELLYSANVAEGKKQAIESQLLLLAKQIAVSREHRDGQQHDVDSANEGFGQLPLVIGRSISKVPGIGEVGLPLEMFNAIKQKSKLVGMAAMKDEVIKVHREKDAIDAQLWLSRQEDSGIKGDADRVVSKLVELGEKLKKTNVDILRENLVDSLKVFLKNKVPLNKVNLRKSGPLPWFQFHSSRLSSNVCAYGTKTAMGILSFELEQDEDLPSDVSEALASGVTLGESNGGYCVGVINLPKDDVWSIMIPISRQERIKDSNESRSPSMPGLPSAPGTKPNSAVVKSRPRSSGKGGKSAREDRVASPKTQIVETAEIVVKEDIWDETDFVTVKLGPTLGSMQTVGTYFNKLNPETGSVLYDVQYTLKGASVAFRFDFSSSTRETSKHLAVGTGSFEEYRVKDLEVCPDPKGRGRERVLSSFVKNLRIEEKQGKLRQAKLLEELVDAESAKTKHWDSDIINEYPQRYSKDFFLRILRAEILLEQRSKLKPPQELTMGDESEEKMDMDDGNDGGSKSVNTVAGMSKALIAKLEWSAKLFESRKHGSQQAIVDKGMDLIGKRIDILDTVHHKWRNVLVKDCTLEWVDNRTKAYLTHTLLEFDGNLEPIGEDFVVDLSLFRYFDSAIQQVDGAAVKKLKEKKMWAKRLNEINDEAEKRVSSMQQAFQEFKQREENAFAREKRKRLKKFLKTVDQQSRLIANSKVGAVLSAIKAHMANVILDMRKGLIPVDEDRNTKTQARDAAKERFRLEWIDQKRAELERSENALYAEVQQRIAGRKEIFDLFKDRILSESASERYNLEWQLQTKAEEEKMTMKKRLKFDPNDFRKAVSQATLCEHLKTKAWGDNYNVGLRCVTCGKELHKLYLEESQMLGYGSGTDPAMYEAIKRHRAKEQSFRFKSSEELAAVEAERRRLEKERREIDENESYFYDFQDLERIYKFDRRHARGLKDSGVFRQGLQWTESELEVFELTKTLEEKKRIKDLGLVETEIRKYDALAVVGEPPPTFRGDDERRKAQFQELMFGMGRVYNFQRKIAKLKEERLDLLLDHEVYSYVIVFLHRDSYQFDDDLVRLEADLDTTYRQLTTYESMRKLWQQANKILSRSKADKKRAEMKQCGVWDAVKEDTNHCSFLHDETRELLKAKVLIDSKLETQQRVVAFGKQSLEEWRTKWAEAEKDAKGMEYRRPGDPVITRYGNGYIRIYRPKDDMVLVTLPFGEPLAKAWIHAPQIAADERARQQGERLLMDQEDEKMKTFVRTERLLNRKERHLMKLEEEGLRRYYEYYDLGKHEDGKITSAIDAAVTETYLVSMSRKYKVVVQPIVEDVLDKFVEEIKVDREEYKGPESGKPKIPTRWQLHKKRKEVFAEMQHEFVLKSAKMAEAKVKSELYEERTDWIKADIFNRFVESTITGMIEDIAKQAIQEGRVAKTSAEKVSGLVFPNPVWMQYGTYKSLATIWKLRKEELKMRIDANRGLAATTEATNKRLLDPKQVAALKEARRRRREERRRQAKLCAEMAAEERQAKAFYHWELLENLRERRQMREEDDYAKRLRKEEEAMKKAAASAYAVSAASQEDEKKAVKVTNFDRRRQELKELTIERRRREEERAHMIIEDDMSKALRELDRVERQRKKFLEEFGVEIDMDGDDEEEDGGEERKKAVIKIPKWMKVPPMWDEWDSTRQIKYIQFQAEMRGRRKVIEKQVRMDEIRLWKLERKSFKEWTARHSVANQKAMESELEMMLVEEEMKEAEANLIDLKDNMKKMLVLCREKGEVELRARTELRRKEQLARRRDKELKEAIEWMELCERRAKTRDKVKRKVTESCMWADTDSITGFHQRFKTENLRARLYRDYFIRMVLWVVNRAETIATERKLMSIQERLSLNRDALDDRVLNMKRVWRAIQRKDLMRMRRSKLNEKLFGRHRRETLSDRFGSWVRFFYWNRGHKEAFQLKYEILKRQLDLERQYRQQLVTNADPYPAKAVRDSFVTTIQRHRERLVQCKLCRTFYLELQNHSIACHYHPSPYGLFCPKSCSNPGLSALCSAHRLRRWRCCDQTKPDATGCSRRSHVPVDSDPIYDKIMEKIVERDSTLTNNLNERVAIARKEDWPKQLQEVVKDQIFVAEDTMAAERATVARFAQLKFV